MITSMIEIAYNAFWQEDVRTSTRGDMRTHKTVINISWNPGMRAPHRMHCSDQEKLTSCRNQRTKISQLKSYKTGSQESKQSSPLTSAQPFPCLFLCLSCPAAAPRAARHGKS
jgi:hypothetical protein